MKRDPIVEETRALRYELARERNSDMDAIVAALRRCGAIAVALSVALTRLEPSGAAIGPSQQPLRIAEELSTTTPSWPTGARAANRPVGKGLFCDLLRTPGSQP